MHTFLKDSRTLQNRIPSEIVLLCIMFLLCAFGGIATLHPMMPPIRSSIAATIATIASFLILVQGLVLPLELARDRPHLKSTLLGSFVLVGVLLAACCLIPWKSTRELAALPVTDPTISLPAIPALLVTILLAAALEWVVLEHIRAEWCDGKEFYF